ncbi:MAG: hypothetical protein K6A65_09310 [Succinivibrionaceae bacterium]|nr:hypothetical protein [Succinivibrionaceae bacterium]
MQYLLKVDLIEGECWRLLAVDGKADLAHLCWLLSSAFGYSGELALALGVGDRLLAAGRAGMPEGSQGLTTLDALGLGAEDRLSFIAGQMRHQVRVMKAEERLWCLIPSCLIGAGLVPEGAEDLEGVRAFLDQDEVPSLDLRAVTNRLRAIGSVRSNPAEALRHAGGEALKFAMK